MKSAKSSKVKLSFTLPFPVFEEFQVAHPIGDTTFLSVINVFDVSSICGDYLIPLGLYHRYHTMMDLVFHIFL